MSAPEAPQLTAEVKAEILDTVSEIADARYSEGYATRAVKHPAAGDTNARTSQANNHMLARALYRQLRELIGADAESDAIIVPDKPAHQLEQAEPPAPSPENAIAAITTAAESIPKTKVWDALERDGRIRVYIACPIDHDEAVVEAVHGARWNGPSARVAVIFLRSPSAAFTADKGASDDQV